MVRSRNCQEEGFLFAWDGGKEVKVSSQSHVKWSLLCPREPQLTAHLSILKIVIDTGKKKRKNSGGRKSGCFKYCKAKPSTPGALLSGAVWPLAIIEVTWSRATPSAPVLRGRPPRCPPCRCTFSVTQQGCVVMCKPPRLSVLACAECPSPAAPARLEVTEAESRVRQHQGLEGARKGASLEPSEGAQPWDTLSSDFLASRL